LSFIVVWKKQDFASSKMTTSTIKEHFESEAFEFDSQIVKIIPYYDQMITALIDAVQFDTHLRNSLTTIDTIENTI